MLLKSFVKMAKTCTSQLKINAGNEKKRPTHSLLNVWQKKKKIFGGNWIGRSTFLIKFGGNLIWWCLAVLSKNQTKNFRKKKLKTNNNYYYLFRARTIPSTLGKTITSWFSRTASTISWATSSTWRIGISQGTLW